MNRISITQALSKFDSLLDKYDNFPSYVYTLEYRSKFYEWIKYLERKNELKKFRIVNAVIFELNGEKAPFWN